MGGLQLQKIDKVSNLKYEYIPAFYLAINHQILNGFLKMGPIKKKHKLMRGTDEDVDVVDKSHGARFWQPSQPSGVISGLAHFFPLHLLLIILMQYPSTYHPLGSVQYSTPYCWALFCELLDQELHYGMFYGLDAATVLRPGEIGPPGHKQINCHDLKRYLEIYFVQMIICQNWCTEIEMKLLI